MKPLSPGFAAHVAGQATTLATLWKLTRADGAVMGFTDHDRTLVVAGIAYEAASGLAASEDVASSGLSVGGLEIDGALSSAAITEADIAAGLYDGAAIEVWLVNWQDVAERLHLRTGTLGEVSDRDGAFRADVRSLASRLDEPRGRIYQHRCDADLGDARCGVDLNDPDLKGTGTVIAASAGRFLTVSGLAAYVAGHFDKGRLAFTSGANRGRAMEVKYHGVEGTAVTVELWQAMSRPVTVGDGFTVTAGCDKLFATCRDRFQNEANFRGFPHVPGHDFVVSHPARSRQENDGGAVVS